VYLRRRIQESVEVKHAPRGRQDAGGRHGCGDRDPGPVDEVEPLRLNLP
jgi:hypothetical protein